MPGSLPLTPPVGQLTIPFGLHDFHRLHYCLLLFIATNHFHAEHAVLIALHCSTILPELPEKKSLLFCLPSSFLNGV
jgi:hypothetical protein